MAGESVGVLFVVVTAIGLAVCWASLRARSTSSAEPSGAAAETPTRVAPDRVASLQGAAIFGLVAAAAAVFVYAWATAFRAAGASSGLPMALFGLPVVAGFVFQWAKWAKWARGSDSADSGSSGDD